MTICLFEKAKRFAEFGDDASVTTVKITRRGRFSNWWAFPILECNYYTIAKFLKPLSRNQKRSTLNKPQSTMGDGSLICPVQVHKTIPPPPPGVSWILRDQKLDVEHRSIDFMLILCVNIVESWKIGIFLVNF